MNTWHCDVFIGDAPDSGNPALVLPTLPVKGRDDYPVVVGFDPDEPSTVRFAAPKGPLLFCGHGSLAVAWVLGRELGVEHLELRTESQTVRAEVEGALARIWMPPAKSARELEPQPALTRALGLPWVLRTFLGDAGSPKWVVEVSPEHIDDLRVDRDALAELSRRAGVNGAYVVAQTGEGVYRARGFNPMTSAGEDRATGVAVAGLAACLGSAVVVNQGPPGARLARLEARPDATGIALLGLVQGRVLEVTP
ncbi:PhzF family phenazine biosynthesis protein [Haliangium ochraceum]|uniref:Phenazine biosynthesis PhzC/PhzF protein n=1 Tax=Haliangium ochraceum (strain DSM 14365 / JCM 11303 / SMP-2) TaxID=502025 RepID=D0LQV7_HALO1|nr:PhzF family phenazine biosynthesis protein [Haliangium ochraceum]ACY13667.1 Phenazine biosynthesis PhzC/PhzF protein [Haliangium ochraceum DSM 14365]